MHQNPAVESLVHTDKGKGGTLEAGCAEDSHVGLRGGLCMATQDHGGHQPLLHSVTFSHNPAKRLLVEGPSLPQPPDKAGSGQSLANTSPREALMA